MARNYALECYLSSVSREIPWDDIDMKSGMQVTYLTCLVLFVNDQVYAYEARLGEEMKKEGLSRGRAWHLYGKLRREEAEYNRLVCGLLDEEQNDRLADILSFMEGEMSRYIDTFMYCVQQCVLDGGVGGSAGMLASIASTVNMLAATTGVTVDAFRHNICRVYGTPNLLEKFRMTKVERLSNMVADALVPAAKKIDLNKDGNIASAYVVFRNRLVSAELFEKSVHYLENLTNKENDGE